VKQAVAVHLGHPEGDILIFMTGQEEIEATCFSLQARAMASLLTRMRQLSLMPLPYHAHNFAKGQHLEWHCLEILSGPLGGCCPPCMAPLGDAA
jgi:hypothetical protein